MIYSKAELQQYYFFDIESIPQKKSLDDLPEDIKELWLRKFHIRYLEKEIQIRRERLFLSELDNALNIYKSISDVEFKQRIDPNEIYIRYSPLHAEFGKVFCISVGSIDENQNKDVVTIHDENEKEILKEFSNFLSERSYMGLGGFNIKSYDIPFLIKRMLINNVPLPSQLKKKKKKPWEVTVIDLAEDWKGMMWEMSSLELVCVTLGLPSPKDEFQNSDMSYLLMTDQIKEKDVIQYCEKDNLSNINLALRLCK